MPSAPLSPETPEHRLPSHLRGLRRGTPVQVVPFNDNPHPGARPFWPAEHYGRLGFVDSSHVDGFGPSPRLVYRICYPSDGTRQWEHVTIGAERVSRAYGVSQWAGT